MSETTVRITMWSGPRNISTAMMRSWGSRSDTFVCDEPLYAHYLLATGLDHPGRDEVMAHHETDWGKVVQWLTTQDVGRPIFYQKHMAHHLLPVVDRGWLESTRVAFLIRDPREMLTSLVRVTPNPTLEDTGLPQQWEMFERHREITGDRAPVLDSKDVLENPAPMLRALCGAIDVPFDEAMLSWKPGPRETDGIWAKYWYDRVEQSRGFAPYQPKNAEVPKALREVHAQCRDFYDRLHEHRLTVS